MASPRVAIIDCPGCGAPLGGLAGRVAPGALVPCLYCGALLHFTASDLAPTIASHIGPELTERIREAALRGGREEALALCIREAGIEPGAAAVAVDDVIKNVASDAVWSQPLALRGWAMFAGHVLVVGAALLAVLAALIVPSPALDGWRWLPLFGGAVVLAIGSIGLFFLTRSALTSIKHMTAARGTARVVQSVRVGSTGHPDGSFVYSLAVDVRAPDVAPFHTRLVLPVRVQSVDKVAVGRELPVRVADGGAWIRSDPS